MDLKGFVAYSMIQKELQMTARRQTSIKSEVFKK